MQRFGFLIVGSRSFNNYIEFKQVVDLMLKNVKHLNIEIVTGDAYGTDEMARKYANENGYEITIFKPDWSIGKSAGFVRNEKMHKYIADNFEKRACAAFWDLKSNGTKHSFELSKKFNNQFKVWDTINHTIYKV